MPQAKNGDTVKVHYKAKTNDQMIFDSYVQNTPLEVTIGNEETIPAFEQALVGMKLGEAKTINVTSDNAFGPYLKDLVMTVERSKLPSHLELDVGKELQIQQGDDSQIIVKITDLNEKEVTFDANHPLAGKDLSFDIELIEILPQ